VCVCNAECLRYSERELWDRERKSSLNISDDIRYENKHFFLPLASNSHPKKEHTHRHTDTHTQTHTHRNTHTLSLFLSRRVNSNMRDVYLFDSFPFFYILPMAICTIFCVHSVTYATFLFILFLCFVFKSTFPQKLLSFAFLFV